MQCGVRSGRDSEREARASCGNLPRSSLGRTERYRITGAQVARRGGQAQAVSVRSVMKGDNDVVDRLASVELLAVRPLCEEVDLVGHGRECPPTRRRAEPPHLEEGLVLGDVRLLPHCGHRVASGHARACTGEGGERCQQRRRVAGPWQKLQDAHRVYTTARAGSANTGRSCQSGRVSSRSALTSSCRHSRTGTRFRSRLVTAAGAHFDEHVRAPRGEGKAHWCDRRASAT